MFKGQTLSNLVTHTHPPGARFWGVVGGQLSKKKEINVQQIINYCPPIVHYV